MAVLNLRTAVTAIGLALLTGTLAQAFDNEESQPAPVSALAHIIDLDDHHALPNWADQGYSEHMTPYLTQDFRRAIETGGKIAGKYRLDVWDADLLTGSQMMVHAKLWRAKIVGSTVAGSVSIDASVTTSGDATRPKDPGHATARYLMKQEGGNWKIDDFFWLNENGEPGSVATDPRQFVGAKGFFLQPQLYVSRRDVPTEAEPYTGDLPLKPGRYAQFGNLCQEGAADNSKTLTIADNNLVNPHLSRSINKILAKDDYFYLFMTRTDQSQAPGYVMWTLTPKDPEQFELNGNAGRDGVWSGNYRRCADDSSDTQAKPVAPLNVETTTAAAPAPTATSLDTKRGIYNGEHGLSFLHNNSWVWLFSKAGLIVYDSPSKALASLVRAGDVVFRGTITRDHIIGKAYVFRSGCPALGYDVAGPGFDGDPASEFTLTGTRPARAGSSCALASRERIVDKLTFYGAPSIGD